MARRPRGLNWSIRNRILVPHLALIVAMVGGTGLACGHWAASRAQEQYLERGRGIAETLQRSRFPWTEAVLRQLKGLGGAEFALVDAAGRVRAGTLSELGSASALFEAGGLASDLSFARTWEQGGVAYRVATLARPDPSDPQWLAILLPEDALHAVAWEARRAAIGSSLVAASLAVLLASWVGRSLSRPLSAILRSIREISRGRLDPSGLPRDRDDEIGELAEGVAQMADRLRRLQDEQIQTERLRLIRQVSAGLAHELRNPLTAARMTLQIYLERNRDRDGEPLRIALAELGRMERQVRRFLQMARPEPPSFEAAEVTPLLDRACAGLAATAEHQGVSLEVEPCAPLPPVRVDPEQIGQALVNLVGNALDAAGPGGRVRLRASFAETNLVSIDVEDDGDGIAPEDESRLFQPFFTTKPEGVGLGLALCAALVREHGGAIEHARLDGWTRFRVTLPAASTMELVAVALTHA